MSIVKTTLYIIFFYAKKGKMFGIFRWKLYAAPRSALSACQLLPRATRAWR